MIIFNDPFSKEKLTKELIELIQSIKPNDNATYNKIMVAMHYSRPYKDDLTAINDLSKFNLDGDFLSDTYARDEGIFGALQVVYGESTDSESTTNELTDPQKVANDIVHYRMREILNEAFEKANIVNDLDTIKPDKLDEIITILQDSIEDN